MKAFTNLNARDPRQAASLSGEARQQGQAAAFASGGSDLLQLIKEGVARPDTVVNLKTMTGLDRVEAESGGHRIGGLMTLTSLHRDTTIRGQYAVLAEAAETVATPQIRNIGTLAGNVCQRPWCWYYRNGFPCFKAGGNQCFSFAGENQFHAIFGGGPSYIVHPSDTAPALVALDARFRVVGPSGTREVPAAEFFVLPRLNATGENVLATDELLVSAWLPALRTGTRSAYRKIMDREAWTHAIVSAAVVLEMNGETVRSARVVLGGVAPTPWRLPAVEQMLAGQRITADLAARAGEQAVAGARPLSKNAYKIPMTRALVRRTILELGS